MVKEEEIDPKTKKAVPKKEEKKKEEVKKDDKKKDDKKKDAKKKGDVKIGEAIRIQGESFEYYRNNYVLIL